MVTMLIIILYRTSAHTDNIVKWLPSVFSLLKEPLLQMHEEENVCDNFACENKRKFFFHFAKLNLHT